MNLDFWDSFGRAKKKKKKKKNNLEQNYMSGLDIWGHIRWGKLCLKTK